MLCVIWYVTSLTKRLSVWYSYSTYCAVLKQILLLGVRKISFRERGEQNW